MLRCTKKQELLISWINNSQRLRDWRKCELQDKSGADEMDKCTVDYILS